MKKSMLFSIASLVLLICSCNNSDTKTDTQNSTNMQMIDTTKLAKGDVFYQCPMDLEVVSDKPGTCPTCGMDLEKMEKK